ncbi:MAG: serine/threonine protein kinase [Deltaproteobacteria bacterium]|nr:MAG: serine/threonine protein kinase [Deltaproteobacteria bacterium]
MLRSPVLRQMVLLVLVMAAAVLVVTALGARQERADLAQVAIEQGRDSTDAELRRFFEPVEANLRVLRGWGATGQLDLEDVAALNARLIPVLESMPQVSSALIGNSDGEEVLLLEDGETWRNRITRARDEPGSVRWLRWNAAGELLEDERKDLDYDGRRRPWYQGAARGDGLAVHWTDPYVFFTTKDPGITASLKWTTDSQTWVVALDVLLADVSVFTSGLAVGETGRVVVLDDTGVMVGLPRDARFSDRASFRGAVLEPPASLGLADVDAATAAWEARAYAPGLARLDHGLWTDLRQLLLGNRVLHIGSLVHESDFADRADAVRNRIIAVTLVGLLLALAFAIFADRALQQRIAREVAAAMRLGQYTIEDKLGAGGMGEVYRARHAMLRRPTAIKLLTQGDSAAIERFEREVQLTASLTHPNTVEVYDYGRTPEGVFYYAMEFIDGLDLADIVALGGPVPAGRVVHLLAQVCGSLAEAHAAGLVHRDIKPANIMVCERGGRFDVVKVVDFGLVTDVDETDKQVIGTPRYMSPEAIESPERIDGRSDLYAVGALGVFLLTGKHAVGGDDVKSICQAHLDGRVLVPSSVVEVPAELESLLLRCLARQPADRPTSAREVAERLEALACYGSWTAFDAEEWWAEHGKGGHRVDRTLSTVTDHTFALTVNLGDRPEAP